MRRSIEGFVPDSLRGFKFVKIENTLFIPMDFSRGSIEHGQLVFGSHKDLLRLMKEDPAALDGGCLQAAPYIQEFTVYGESETLNLPVEGYEEEARARTAARLIEIFPGYTVNSNKGRVMEDETIPYDELSFLRKPMV